MILQSLNLERRALLQREYDKAVSAIGKLYTDIVVPVLVATEQLKFISGGGIGGSTKMKPSNPEYYLSNLIGDKSRRKYSYDLGNLYYFYY